MRWGIAFKLEVTKEHLLTHFPNPTAKVRFQNRAGLSDYINVYYLFDYAPQSFKELQRISGIKEQMAEQLPLEFIEEMDTSIEPEETGHVWKVNELGQYFNKYIEFPNPLYPQSRHEFMRNLTFYAQRLYYQQRLYFESLLAIAIHFNTYIKEPYSRKDLQRKASSIMQLDHSSWKRRLNEKDLQEAHRKGGKTRGKQISEEAYFRSEMIQALLPDYQKENGKYDVSALAKYTKLSKRTIYTQIKKSKSP